jgi:hypothetical protein
MIRGEISGVSKSENALSYYLLVGLMASMPSAAIGNTVTRAVPTLSADGGSAGDAANMSFVESGGPIADYFAGWQDRVDAAKASQPEWSSPIVTTTSMLEERFRFDTQYQASGNGTKTWDVDGGKGVDLIVGDTTEIQIAAAPYYLRDSDQKNNKGELSGFADWPAFRIKERLLSSPESEGDYVVSAWLQLQDAAGIKPLTNNSFTLLPTIGFGKGWGPYVIQGTIGATIPTDHESKLGTQIASNTAFQYHVGRYFWPQIETNVTYWTDGQRGRKTQLYLTPGLVVGRFKLNNHLKFTAGLGYAVAVTPHYQATPLLPAYNRAWILTLRLGF